MVVSNVIVYFGGNYLNITATNGGASIHLAGGGYDDVAKEYKIYLHLIMCHWK